MKAYNKANIPLAKTLRKNMTPWERKLWYDYLRHYPVRFQRQKAIGEYIADFYCAKARLVIELDGGGHYGSEQAQADATRTKSLESMNLRVLRVCNIDVDRNFSGVCEYIDSAVQESLPQSAALTAPSSEGALSGATQERTIYALGVFDGVHIGHQALLTACRQMAEEAGCNAGVVTFLGHPDALVLGKSPLLINTVEDRRRLLTHYNIASIVELPFDRRLMTMPWGDFIRLLRQDYHGAGFVCGSDFRFGHKGEGTAQILQQYCRQEGLPCTVVAKQTRNGVTVSSTHIRSLLEQGEMEEAASFLGHPHCLSGTVEKGRQLGRTIGIPTANLHLPEGTVMPKFGVYACKALVDGKEYPAVTNIGTRPTVGGHRVTVEPWILDFDGDLYGQELTLLFYSFLRPERKFDSLQELQAEIQKNAETTRFLLKNT